MTRPSLSEERDRTARLRPSLPAAVPRWVVHVGVVATLATLAALLRVEPLGVSSLWLDDAWVALATRITSLGDLRLVGLTAPGFSLVLAGWLAATGGSATAAQLLPFLLAVAAPPALYLVITRRCHAGRADASERRAPHGADTDDRLVWQGRDTGSPLVAILAGVFLAVAPVGIHFATRVKQYSLDALLAVALLGLGWWVAQRPAGTRRWAWLTAAGLLATVLTAAVVPVVIGAFVAGGIAAWRHGRRARRSAATAAGGFALLGGAWWFVVLRPAVNDALRTYWEGHYLRMDDGWLAAVADVPRILGDVLVAASPLPVWASAGLLVAGVGWLAVRRPIVSALVVVPLLVGLALAALQVAPLGGGRTDHHLFPGIALAMAFALEPSWLTRRTVAVGAAVSIAAALVVTTPTPRPYPQQDLRPLVERLDDELGLEDTVLVYPSAVWAFALYTDLPVDVTADPGSIWRWRPEVLDPRVAVLRPHRSAPDRYGPEVTEAVDGTAGAVWLVASHYREDIRAIEDALRDEGFAPIEQWRRPGSRITRWER